MTEVVVSVFRFFIFGYGRGGSARWFWWRVKVTLGYEGGLELGTPVVGKV